MASWDETKPADSDIVSQFPVNERAARSAAKTNFGVDHHEADDADVGKHEVVQLLEQAVDPTIDPGASGFYAKAVSGVIELFFKDSAGTVLQLTSAGKLKDVALLNTEDQALTGGVVVTSKDLGTISTGTVTPDPGDRPMQHYTNGGAHTLAPSANFGSVLVDITNNATAGSITTSGFTFVTGDAFTTTDGHKFRCHISIGNAGSLLSVQALQ